jgi:hypothetical protein
MGAGITDAIANSHDQVLTDVGMPARNGAGIMEAIKAGAVGLPKTHFEITKILDFPSSGGDVVHSDDGPAGEATMPPYAKTGDPRERMSGACGHAPYTGNLSAMPLRGMLPRRLKRARRLASSLSCTASLTMSVRLNSLHALSRREAIFTVSPMDV